jgi:hypothetical protein
VRGTKKEWKLITNIKNKMIKNQLIITKANKGKTLVIITQEEYKHKTNNSIQDNQFTMINNPTQYYQKKKIEAKIM